jgi:hypothetical protein
MFGYFKNLKIKREAARLLAEKKVIAIKTEMKIVDKKASDISYEKYNKGKERDEQLNSICPKCRSKNVNDRIKRQQGFLNGDISGSSWNALTFGSGSLSGRIHGEMDTNEVNKCNDCEHEWKKYKSPYEGSSACLKGKLEDVLRLLELNYYANNCEFDPMDLKEEYNSLEEKKAALSKEAKENWRWREVGDFWKDISIDTVKVLAEKYLYCYDRTIFSKYYDESILLKIGFRKE